MIFSLPARLPSLKRANLRFEPYSARDISVRSQIIRLLSRETIPMETDYKVLEDYAITMKSGDVYTYGIITVIVIPLVIFGFGIAVYLKRKHL